MLVVLAFLTNGFKSILTILSNFSFLFRSTKRFGSDGKRFEHLSFLNLAQNVVCLIWSYISEFLLAQLSTILILFCIFPWHTA